MLLAPDPDREGEAIAWHLADYLAVDRGASSGSSSTRSRRCAIQSALKRPRMIDHDLVDAQQARRVLDRLVGYLVSPFLWTTIRYGLSAGRVQSVALRMICDREDEVEGFRTPNTGPSTSCSGRRARSRSVSVSCGRRGEAGSAQRGGGRRGCRRAERAALRGHGRQDPAAAAQSLRAVHHLDAPAGGVPSPPLPAKKTMGIAQELYEGLEAGDEGVVGLITYMRTDSTRVSGEAQTEARAWVTQTYGRNMFRTLRRSTRRGPGPRMRTRRSGRPRVYRRPDSITSVPDERPGKLYPLIWNRFLASQMAPAVSEVTTIEVEAGRFQLRATGSRLLFDGFTRLYEERPDEDASHPGPDEEGGRLPEVAKGEALDYRNAEKEQHFTQPPPRFTEATLVKALEERGIGRPSTYATIVSTILTRDYVQRDKGRLHPTDLGRTVTRLLVSVFSDIFDVDFTARMEAELDKIETGEDPWVDVVRAFYDPFERTSPTRRGAKAS